MIPKNKIEEAALENSIGTDYPETEQDAFYVGVKWAEKELENLAIEFAEWISNNPLNFQSASKQRFIGLNMKYYTAEELFEIFKKENYDTNK